MIPCPGIASALRRCLVAGALLAVAACSTAQGPIETGPGFRDQRAPIGVTSRFDENKFAGSWRVRAYLPDGEEIDAVALDDRASGLQLQVTAFVCDPAGICGNFGDTLRVFREGDAKYLVQMPGGDRRRIWVLWVDEGFRTAVVGNPEGTFAWILDRRANGGTDRMRAAREILEFNGYDPRQLKEAS